MSLSAISSAAVEGRVARRTIAAIKGKIASRYEEEVDLVLFRLDIFAYGIDILYQ